MLRSLQEANMNVGCQFQDNRSTVTVIVADSHPSTVAAIARLLEAQPGISVVAQARDQVTTVRLLARHRPSVLVLDPAILGDQGLGRIALLQAASPSTRVLATGMGDAAGWSKEVRRYGCAGYVVKHSSPETWVRAVRGAADSTAPRAQH
jgi:two-component system invasion response regulator UvrY